MSDAESFRTIFHNFVKVREVEIIPSCFEVQKIVNVVKTFTKRYPKVSSSILIHVLKMECHLHVALHQAIFIGNNTISGNIPIEIGQLQLLHGLSFRKNNFSSNIPEHISNLENLEALDLSRNQFTGNIPSSFTKLNFLAVFNVSYNNLEGSIPRGTQHQSFNASAFEGNLKLCGPPLPNECPANDDNDNAGYSQDHTEDEHENLISWFHTSIILGFIVGFWEVCCPLVLKKKWRYGYFKFLNRAQDFLYVIIIDCVYGKRRLRR
ncbi:receptor-like protein 8 [Rosa chinensis]|uniref:receptor-like protein 8 n=1 Tax=Rosa chinensis TaxID=74649 RepID=UPI001AD8CCB7|nr:receptor-like protein 8 [Rosa chinensis]